MNSLHEVPNEVPADGVHSDLAGRAMRSVMVTASAQVYKFVLMLGSTMVLARLLDPSAFGLVAMASVFTNLLLRFRDGGLSMATIQKPQITQEQVSIIFWINVIVGVVLALLSASAAPVVALIYGEPRLTWIMVTLASTFAIGGFSIQHDALLRRAMRFRTIALVECVAKSLGIVMGIACALLGMGYWTLVWMSFATTTFQVVFTCLASGWRPGKLRRGTGVRPMLNFGINLSGANFVAYFASNMMPFLIGMVGGSAQIGYYNRANNLSNTIPAQILAPIINVAQPALARVASAPDRFRRAVLSIFRKLSLLTMFITVTTAALADWVVAVVLGPGWDVTVPMFRLLAVFAIVEPMAGLVAVVLLSAGHARQVLIWKIIELVIIGVSMVIGLYWGVFGAIASYAISGIALRFPLLFAYVTRYLPISLMDFARSLAPGLVMSLVLLLILLLFRSVVMISNPFVGLAIVGTLAAAVYAGMVFSVKSTRREVLDIFQILLKQTRREPN